MATILTGSLSTPICASSGSESRKPDPARRRPATSSSSFSSSSTGWWAPLFGWSPGPDYINNTNERKKAENPDPDSDRVRSRFAPGCFTEEKAKQLRRKTMEGASFHDVMYHSAIASRLASDASVWSESEM